MLLTCVSSVSCTTLILLIVVLAVAAVFVRGHEAAVVPVHEQEAAVA